MNYKIRSYREDKSDVKYSIKKINSAINNSTKVDKEIRECKSNLGYGFKIANSTKIIAKLSEINKSAYSNLSNIKVNLDSLYIKIDNKYDKEIEKYYKDNYSDV